MGSLGELLGYLWCDLTHDMTDPNYPPMKFTIESGYETDLEISLVIKKKDQIETFHEGDCYPAGSLLDELYNVIMKAHEEERDLE